MNSRHFDQCLYWVLDPTVARNRSVSALMGETVRGRVNIVQLREKQCSDEEFVNLAKTILDFLKPFEIPLIINDRVDLAIQVRAQGVHIGQSDLHWSEARRLLGPDALIGLSVENKEQAMDAERACVDYLGVSSIFPTQTKQDIKTLWGLQGLHELRGYSRHKLIGIGGINERNVVSVLNAGADGVAFVSSICSSLDPKGQIRRLRRLIDQHQSFPYKKS